MGPCVACWRVRFIFLCTESWSFHDLIVVIIFIWVNLDCTYPTRRLTYHIRCRWCCHPWWRCRFLPHPWRLLHHIAHCFVALHPWWCCRFLHHPWRLLHHLDYCFVALCFLCKDFSTLSGSSRDVSLSDPGNFPFNASMSSLAAWTMASAGVTVGFVMCLCLKKTVSVLLTAPVPLTHMS